MIIERKKFGFRTVEVILEDEVVPEIIKSEKHSVIVILSYKKLDLGPIFLVRQKKTSSIYFEGGIDEVFKKFHDTTRNEIRRTEKIGNLAFSVQKIDENNIDETYNLYKSFQLSKSFRPIAKTAMIGLSVASARHNGELISAISFYDVKPYLRIRSIFSKRIGTEDANVKQLIGMATRRLVYEICKWGAENHYLLLDLASVNFTDPEKAGITQFKLSFGGKIEEEYTYIYKSKSYIFYERLKRFFSKFFGR